MCGNRTCQFLWGTLVVTLLMAAVAMAPAVSSADGHPQDEPTPFPTAQMSPALASQVRAIEETVSEIRDLRPVAPINRVFITRRELEAYVRDRITGEYPPEAARDDAIVYHAFGFMSADTDLLALQIALMTEQIAGFYEPESETMFVLTDSETLSPMEELVYAHEFTHLLQDQHFDLTGIGLTDEAAREDPDGSLALMALVEGDATLLMQLYLAARVSNDPGFGLAYFADTVTIDTEVLNSAPGIVQSELMFPYVAGLRFVSELYNRGGWPLVDAAFEHRPASTEQIIHPERYFSRDEPDEVTLASTEPPGDGWRLVRESTLGEFYLLRFLELELSQSDAGAAATGWGGDRFAVFYNEGTGQTAFVLMITWDLRDEADEFAGIFQQFGIARYGAEPTRRMAESRLCWSGADVLCFSTREATTLIVNGPGMETIDALMAPYGEFR